VDCAQKKEKCPSHSLGDCRKRKSLTNGRTLYEAETAVRKIQRKKGPHSKSKRTYLLEEILKKSSRMYAQRATPPGLGTKGYLIFSGGVRNNLKGHDKVRKREKREPSTKM